MSRQALPIFTDTIVATGAGEAHRFITEAGARAAVGAIPAGVARTAYAADDAVPVDRLGTAILEAGGAVAKGARLAADAVGRGVSVTPKLKTAVIAGGAAGAHTVTGILATDELVSVVRAVDDGSGGAILTIADLTAEFTITAANTIDNTGGTATSSGDRLFVIWRQVRPVGAIAKEAAGAAGELIEVFLVPAIG
jgi:hypothetical protein